MHIQTLYTATVIDLLFNDIDTEHKPHTSHREKLILIT